MDVRYTEPILIRNFFDEKDIESIYSAVDALYKDDLDKHGDKYKSYANSLNGFYLRHQRVPRNPLDDRQKDPYRFEQYVIDKVRDRYAELMDSKVGNLGITYARYTLDTGRRPQLLPHVDRVYDEAALSATVHLNKTLDWDIYVGDEKFTLNTGDALFFSGTHHLHWRPDVEFTAEDYFDILILHATPDIPIEPKTGDDLEKFLEQKQNKFTQLFTIL